MNLPGPDPQGRHRRPLTLLHTSDLHIGMNLDPTNGWSGLEAVLQIAHDIHADAILIAGDLFDSDRVPEDLVTHVLEALALQQLHSVILPGNHDGDILTRHYHPSHHPNVHVLTQEDGHLLHLPHLDLTLWGKPVYDHTPDFHPLEGLQPRPLPPEAGWYVVLAHGLVTESNTLFPSSPITPQELAQADCDYIALGHVHVFRDVTAGPTPAIYSGAPSGPQQPSAAIVRLSPDTGVDVETLLLPRTDGRWWLPEPQSTS